MDKKQEARLITMIKISTWKIKNKIRHIESNTLHKKDIEDQLDLMKSIIRKKLAIMYNKTQLDYFATETNPKKIEYTINQITRAIKWEIATSKEILEGISNLKYADNTPFKEEDILSCKEAIAKGLELKNNPNTFDREKQIAYYRNEIAKALDIDIEEIIYILDDIKKMCEYDSVLGAIHNCAYIGSLPKRNRREIHKEKMKLEKIKKDTIDRLKFLKLPYDNVEKKTYDNGEKDGWVNYEMTLKHIRKVLYDDLTLICGTGKKRAKDITKILKCI